MPKTKRISVSLDSDLIEPAWEKARKYASRFSDKGNLSAYISDLLRKDLGMEPSGANSPHGSPPADPTDPPSAGAAKKLLDILTKKTPLPTPVKRRQSKKKGQPAAGE